MELIHLKQLGGSRYMTLAVKGWLELLETNNIRPGLQAVGWDHEAIVALDSAAAIGILTFTNSKWTNSIITNIAWVVPNQRLKGVHKAMFHKLREIAKEENVNWIDSSVNKNNLSSQIAHERENRLMIGYNHAYQVNDF